MRKIFSVICIGVVLFVLGLSSVILLTSPIRTSEPKEVRQCSVYPLSTTVTAIENDIVTVETFSGNRFSFKGADDWMIGDICALIMNDMGTDSVLDDEIIGQPKYCGYVK